VFNNQTAHWVDLAQLIICVFLKFGLVEVELARNLLEMMPGYNSWEERCGSFFMLDPVP